MRPTKSGTGRYLKLTFEIREGEFRNRLLWANLNLENDNDMAVEIARSDLSAICRAVGIMQPDDSRQLHNIPMMIHVQKKKNKQSDEMENKISGYSRVVAIGTPMQERQPQQREQRQDQARNLNQREQRQPPARNAWGNQNQNSVYDDGENYDSPDDSR